MRNTAGSGVVVVWQQLIATTRRRQGSALLAFGDIRTQSESQQSREASMVARSTVGSPFLLPTRQSPLAARRGEVQDYRDLYMAGSRSCLASSL